MVDLFACVSITERTAFAAGSPLECLITLRSKGIAWEHTTTLLATDRFVDRWRATGELTPMTILDNGMVDLTTD